MLTSKWSEASPKQTNSHHTGEKRLAVVQRLPVWSCTFQWKQPVDNQHVSHFHCKTLLPKWRACLPGKWESPQPLRSWCGDQELSPGRNGALSSIHRAGEGAAGPGLRGGRWLWKGWPLKDVCSRRKGALCWRWCIERKPMVAAWRVSAHGKGQQNSIGVKCTGLGVRAELTAELCHLPDAGLWVNDSVSQTSASSSLQ